eukprot:6489056-Amphidinium_carterae.1
MSCYDVGARLAFPASLGMVAFVLLTGLEPKLVMDTILEHGLVPAIQGVSEAIWRPRLALRLAFWNPPNPKHWQIFKIG